MVGHQTSFLTLHTILHPYHTYSTIQARPPCRFEVIPLNILSNSNGTNTNTKTNTSISTNTNTHTNNSTSTSTKTIIDNNTNTTTNTSTNTSVTPIGAVRVHVVLDIAHNIAAIHALVDKVKLHYPVTPIR